MSNTRNGLLAQIVQASGGTVTDASNRNSLLQDWLNAVSGPVGRWYFTGNGVDQYIDVGNITYTNSLSLNFKFVINSTASIYTLFASGGNGDSIWVYIESSTKITVRYRDSTGSFVFKGFNVNVNPNVEYDFNFKYESDIFTISLNGNEVSQSATDHQPISGIKLLMYRGTFGIFSGRIWNFVVNDGSVYNFPLDDSFANNPVARNTGSGADGTYINATEASWTYEVPQAKRWYFTANGVDQYVSMPSIEVTSANPLTFKFKGEDNRSGYLLDDNINNPDRGYLLIENGGLNTLAWSEVLLDGVQITNGHVLPTSGDHTLELRTNFTRYVSFVSSRFSVGTFGNFTIFDLKLGDGSVYNFPFDDSFANNPVARNTGTGANATYINATEASWTYE